MSRIVVRIKGRKVRIGKEKRMQLGAFNRGVLDVDIEHLFRRSDQLVGLGELDAIRRRGRTPLLTVEPWAGLGDLIGRLGDLGPCLLRYGHEMNGTWYPWSLDPDKLMFELGYIAYHKPKEVKLVWCPNVDYPGARPMSRFWPGADVVDILGLDGYAWPDQGGMSFSDIFNPSLLALHGMAPDKPLMICEVASPRNRGQAPWIRRMWRDMPRFVDSVCWFNTDKEQPWALSPTGKKAFLANGWADHVHRKERDRG